MIELFAEVFNIPKNERTAFVKFARGNLQVMPVEIIEDKPWHPLPSHQRSKIPSSTTSLIGREQEIADIRSYLLNVDIRLVTLLGPPGIGKTRLGLETARAVLSDFPDGIFFVALAPLDDSSLIASTILQTLGYVEAKSQLAIERVVESIGDKQMLLVLDNVEHLIEGSAPLVSRLLSACSHLKILITSREAVRISGEWLYSVPPLNIPRENSSIDLNTASQFPALTLFIERARAVRADFALNDDNIQVVASICTQLDGLPLAIELIAARMRLMSPQALLERLNSQYVLSADGMRAESARQKTLHNAIGWSYNLLSSDEKNLFACLSIFAGGFTLDAAESIFSHMFTDKSVSDLIALLLDKSLLQRTLDARSEFRYDMLVTIKHFALNSLRQMGLDEQVQDWHLNYFLKLAEQADKEIHGPEQVFWMDQVESENDNFHAAFDWCIAHQKTEAALRLLSALCWSWDVRSHYSEMHSWFDKIRKLPRIDDHPAVYANVLNHAAQHKWMLGDFRDAQSLLEESRAIWLKLGKDGEQGLAKTLDWLGMVARWGMGDNSTANPLFEQSFIIYKNHGNQMGMAESMFHLAIVELDRGNADKSLSLFEQSMTLYRQLGDLWGIARVSQLIGQQFLNQGNYEQARFFFDQHLTIDEGINFIEGIQVALCNFGNLYRYQGDYAQAEQFYEKSLIVCRDHGLKDDISNILFSLGLLALHQNDYRLADRRFNDFFSFASTIYEKTSTFDFLTGLAAVAAGTNQPERAAKLSGAAQAILKSIDVPNSPFDRAEFERHLQVARDQLGEAAFEAYATAGREMSVDQAVAYVLGT